MPKYIAVLKQAGEGCGYTIGCGLSVEELGEHPNAVDAFTGYVGRDDGFASFYERHLKDRAEWRLQSFTIYEVAAVSSVDLAALKTGEEQRRADAAKQKADAKERAEYERLAKKYGGQSS